MKLVSNENGARRRSHRIRRTSRQVGSVLLFGVVCVAPTLALTGGWFAANRIPAELSVAPTPVEIPVSSQVITDVRAVTLALTWRDGPALAAPAWTGLVTQVAVDAGDTVANGDRIVQVDGIWRVGASTSQPFYGVLTPDSDPAEIERLNAFLRSMSFNAGEGKRWSWSTTEGVRAFAASIGADETDLKLFDPAWVVWLPDSQVQLDSVDVQAGALAPSMGSVVASTSAVLVGVATTPAEGQSLPQERELNDWAYRYGEVEVPYSSEASPQNASFAPLGSAIGTSRPESVTAELVRLTPFEGWEVPSSAVYIDDAQHTCVFITNEHGTYEPLVVDVVAGSMGVARVSATSLPPRAQLLANPASLLKAEACV